MGLTYQEFKKLGKNRIVLEKQENIEIQQNSSSYCSIKRRLIREKFYTEQTKETETHNSVGKSIPRKGSKLKSSKASENISKLWLDSSSDKEENKRFEEKIDKTSMHLESLQHAINDEIEKLKKQRSNIIMKMKAEEVSLAEDFTWAENLANNCPQSRRSVDIAKEKFSSQHQGAFTSPRYGSDQDEALRPRTRTVALQIDTIYRGSRDKGAVGDHNSFNSLERNKIHEISKSIKDVLLTPSIHRRQDEIVNCCYNHTFHPVNEYCSMVKGPVRVACQHHNFEQSSVQQPHREYKYCLNKYCYDYSSWNQPLTPPPPQASCYCVKSASKKHINTPECRTSCYGRHGTDLKTEEFYCRPTLRSKSKSKKEAIESRHNKHYGMSEEYVEGKERECKKKHDTKRVKSQGKTNEEAKLPHNYHENSSKLVQHLDRYVDERKKCVDSIIKKHKHLAEKFYEDTTTARTTGTTVKISSKSKIYCITVPNEQQYEADASLESRYSVETLHMLKKMKIKKYVAAKPSVIKNKSNKTKSMDKMKKYQEYLEKYRKEELDNIVKQTSDENIKILKEPPELFEAAESEKLLQQDQTVRNPSISDLQPDTTVGQRKESNYSKEPCEKFTSKQRNIYEYGSGKTENTATNRDNQERDSKSFEKLKTKTYRYSKNDDNKSHRRECINRKSENYQEKADYKYSNRENKKSEADQTHKVYRTSFDNDETAEITPQEFVKPVIESDKESYREPTIKQERGKCHENDYRISDDKILTRENGSSYHLEERANVLLTPGCSILPQKNQTTRALLLLAEQPQNTSSQQSESYYSQEAPKKFTNKVEDSQPLEEDTSFKNLEQSPRNNQREKNSTTKYIVEGFKEQSDTEYETFYGNGKPVEISSPKLTKRSIEYDQEIPKYDYNLADKKFMEHSRSEETDNYNEKKQSKTSQASTSSSYRNFKETMDQNIRFYNEASSQTNYTTEKDLMQSESTKTFITEMKQEKEPYSLKNTEEALEYLKSFLTSCQQYDLEEECKNSLSSAAQDLINKLSSCKINKSTHILEEELTSHTEYQDPESTLNTSRIEQENEDKNAFSTNKEQDTPFEAIPTCSYSQREAYNYHSQLKNPDWQTEEDYQQYLEYKQQTITTCSIPSDDFINEDHYQYTKSLTQILNSSEYLKNISKFSLTHNNEYEKAYPTEEDANMPLSSYESEYYEAHRPQPRSMIVYPLCSREVLPIKGILKPCRARENGQNVACEEFDNKNTQRDDHLLRCTNRHQQIDHQGNEILNTVIANNQNLQPFMEYSELQHTAATTSRQLLYDNCLQNDNLPNSNEDDKRFLYTVDLPNFKRCPCMLDTYLKMLEAYYRAGNR